VSLDTCGAAGCGEMWNHPLIVLPDGVLERLVETAEEQVSDGGSEGAYKMFLSISKLARKVKTSPMKARWEEMLLRPVTNVCARVAATGLGDGYLAGRVRRLQKFTSFEKRAVGEFLECIAGTVTRRNANTLWLGFSTMADSGEVRKARELMRKWWKMEWSSIAADGGFMEWKDEERSRLAGELRIAVEDLGVNKEPRAVRGGSASRGARWGRKGK